MQYTGRLKADKARSLKHEDEFSDDPGTTTTKHP